MKFLGALRWLALLAFGSYARLPEPQPPEVGDFPVPTLLLLGGVLVGVLLALVCRWLVALTARSRLRAAAGLRLRLLVQRSTPYSGRPSIARACSMSACVTPPAEWVT